MTKTVTEKMRIIQKKLWEEATETEDHDNVVNEDKFIMTVEQVAGGHRNTIATYREKMDRHGLVDDHGDLFIVYEPEKKRVEPTGEEMQLHTRVPRELKEAADNFNISIKAVVTEALAEEIADVEEYVSMLASSTLNEEEVEFVFRLLKYDLYRKRPDMAEDARVDLKRVKHYCDVFDVSHSEHDEDRREELRKEAYKVAQKFGLVSRNRGI